MDVLQKLKQFGTWGVLLSSIVGGAAHASSGELWIGYAALICVVQDPANEKTPIGSVMFSSPGIQKVMEKLVSNRACVIQKAALSPELCTAVLQDVAPSKRRINDLYERHAGEIMRLQALETCEVSAADKER